MKINESPYQCHIFVCTKTRDGIRRSCGDHDNGGLKAALKQEIKDRGWKSRVRVSDSGCLGLCDEGPNVLIHPQKIWLSAVTSEDIPDIIQTIEKLLES
ncbi:MAG: (2Fe-2S) ferredoxin domain-containing protein [Pontiellaceae bacterium]|nr:(2Fe-2S) ferredoxin domain-containing protein [Pontiellaceae bacterium]MBN2783576.1 (2Fe-2S) ferredoxin domain-containing protein [Pontiellaceae bacterium]